MAERIEEREVWLFFFSYKIIRGICNFVQASVKEITFQKRAREEAEQKAKEKEEALTPEERRTELLRRQRLQEEADLRLAMETFGLSNLVDFSPRKPHKRDKK